MKKELNLQFQKQVLIEQKLSSSIIYYIRNAYLEFRRRTCYFCLAFFSVTIVVAAAAVAKSVIDRAPVIFLSSAEASEGQTDFEIYPASSILNPGPFASQSLLNMTRVNDILKDSRSEQTSPRFILGGFLVAQTDKVLCSIDQSSVLKMFNTAHDCKMITNGVVYFMDQEKEKEIGLGDRWNVVDLKEGEVMIHKNLQHLMGLNIGDQIYMKTDGYQILIYNLAEAMCGHEFTSPYCKSLFVEMNRQKEENAHNSLAFIVIPFKVTSIFTDEGGKFGSTQLDSYIIANFDYLLSYVRKYIYPTSLFFQQPTKNEFLDFIDTQDPHFYTSSIKLNFKNRDDAYLDNNYDNIQYKVTHFASNLANDLGVYPIDLDWPILNSLYGTRFAGMFLGIVLNLIIFVLFILSVMLLYNLLLVSVETKTYELGVLRVLGLNKIGVIFLIITQSLSYVIPAVFVGFCLAFPLLGVVSQQLKKSMSTGISQTPTGSAIVFGLILGILIPLISSVVPIKEALKQTLSVAIDQQRSKSQAVKIDIDVEGKGIPWGIISFALITSLFGISIYYLLPLALLSFDFALLISIFFWILIGLLVGCILLAMNVQYLFEKLVMFSCFFWVKAAIRTIVIKNLAAHRLKNRRTAIMYGLSIAFVIFVWTSMTVQIVSIDFANRQKKGAYMTVTSKENYTLDADMFETIIATKLQDCVKSHSWITLNLNRFLGKQGVQKNFVTHLGRIYEIYPSIVGVSPNYLHTAFKAEFEETLESSDSGLDVVEELYTPRGSQSMILGQTYKNILFPTLDIDSSLLSIAYNGTKSKSYEMRVSAFSKQMPGLVYSALPSVTSQNIAVSLPAYLSYVGQFIDGALNMPMDQLLFDFHPSCRQQLYDVLKEQINSLSLPAKIWDYNETLSSTNQQKSLINVIFTVLCGIVMILSFFSLVSSMTANILEQSKEIAVLRAVGITILRMKTIYFFEAFTLVFSSCLIGSIVGIGIGFTMSMQRALFTDLPIQFVFPYAMFIVMFIASIGCAFFSTILPITRILNNNIAQIIRLTS